MKNRIFALLTLAALLAGLAACGKKETPPAEELCLSPVELSFGGLCCAD